jgi:anti-anti-sigma factor
VEASSEPGGIEIQDVPGRTVVRLWGEVDASLREQASAAMVRLLERRGPYVVDVSDVTFIDSSAIAFVIQLHRVASDEGSRVVLRDPPRLVMDTLRLVGLEALLEVESPVVDATNPVTAGGNERPAGHGDRQVIRQD